MGADISRSHRKPIVLLANREAGEVKELETALYSAGYQVVLARSDRETLEKVHAHGPDAVLLDREVGSGGYTLCETLRRDSALSPAAPILLSQDEAPSHDNRLAAFRAGAWDIEGHPANAEELLLRLANYLQAKLEIDKLTAECLIDRGSGLYNSHGFAQRATELAALTSRQGSAAACIVFQPAQPLPTVAFGDRLGRAFKAAGRLSDAIGRTAPAEFAVFAPATNDWAAARLVSRIRDNVARKGGVTLRAGFSAAAAAKIDARALLERARQALQTR